MDSSDEDMLLRESRLRVQGWSHAPLQLRRIQKGASERHYYRVEAKGAHDGPASVILMVYTDGRPDNLSFFAATEVLRLAGANVPHIYAHDEIRRRAWIEDLGPSDLWTHRSDESLRTDLYRRTLDQAVRIHRFPPGHVPEPLRGKLQPPFDEELYLWEHDYFFDQFAARASVLDQTQLGRVRAHRDFSDLRTRLATLPRYLVHRDLQSQNIMVRGGEVWLIDHQGLRPGRPEYDLASLLYDPYMNLSSRERDSLTDYYYARRSGDADWPRSEEVLAMCVCQRLMQALGAYGKLGLLMKNDVYRRHIPTAVMSLRAMLDRSGLLPCLRGVLELRPGIEGLTGM